MTHNLLQGSTSNSFKQDNRAMLESVHSLPKLDKWLQNLTGNQHKVLEHVEGNLKIVLMGLGYMDHDSPFL